MMLVNACLRQMEIYWIAEILLTNMFIAKTMKKDINNSSKYTLIYLFILP